MTALVRAEVDHEVSGLDHRSQPRLLAAPVDDEAAHLAGVGVDPDGGAWREDPVVDGADDALVDQEVVAEIAICGCPASDHWARPRARQGAVGAAESALSPDRRARTR